MKPKQPKPPKHMAYWGVYNHLGVLVECRRTRNAANDLSSRFWTPTYVARFMHVPIATGRRAKP